MSRTLILAIILSFNATWLLAQKNNSGEKYFAYDRNWNTLNSLDTATYFARAKKINDTCWEVLNYSISGPMISKEVYKDEANKIAHGTWVFYKRNGYMDSVCNFQNNLAHGFWYYTNDTNRVYKEKEFEHGKLKAVTDVIKRDSIRKANEDTTKKRVERESEFMGTGNAWRKYLEKNFKYPERALKNGREGMVVVQFVVDTQGNVGMIDIYKSVEFSLDEEAKRLIIKSPKWSPAVQDGNKVKSYKRQPVIFRTQ
jgi:protein TonB